MTIPTERTRAVLQAQRFLSDLRNPKLYPRVPKQVREEAYRILRHFPTTFDLTLSSDAAPDTWADPDQLESSLLGKQKG